MTPRHRQRGSVAPFMVLALGGALLATAYSIETSRMSNGAAQLKRATDAAALAVTMAYASDQNTDVQALAERYVQANLGLDSEYLSHELNVAVEPVSQGEATGYRVLATYQAQAPMLDSDAEISAASAAVAVHKALEVALTLPNTINEDSGNLAVLRRLGKHFAEELFKDRDDAWLAVVPYSQSVNVSPNYTNPSTRTPRGPSGEHTQRLRQWSQGSALRPVELTSLFRTGYSGLQDARMPDRRANLLCLYRGLKRGENYFWDQAPGGQFQIYYRHDLPENGSPGADPIRWIGPNPEFGRANGANDTRWLVADRGCPSAPLLPLSQDLKQIEERLQQMSTRFNVNYAIAMGWSAMALAPAFRGTAGWGLEDDLPKDFEDEGGDSYKTIVMLANTTGQLWFDSDGYNAYVGQAPDGQAASGGENLSLRTQRLAQLCDSFKARKLRFFMIVVGEDAIENHDLRAEGTLINAASDFQRIAGPGLARCAEQSDDITYLSGFDFEAVEGRIQERLEQILANIRQQSNYVRLIE